MLDTRIMHHGNDSKRARNSVKVVLFFLLSLRSELFDFVLIFFFGTFHSFHHTH